MAVNIALIVLLIGVIAIRGEPMITASPAVLPYVTSPNTSSFFPSPTDEWTTSADPPKPEEAVLAPVPSSGEFIGRTTSAAVVAASLILVLALLEFVLLFLLLEFESWIVLFNLLERDFICTFMYVDMVALFFS